MSKNAQYLTKLVSLKVFLQQETTPYYTPKNKNLNNTFCLELLW